VDLEGKVALVDDDPFSLTAWWIFSHAGFFFFRLFIRGFCLGFYDPGLGVCGFD